LFLSFTILFLILKQRFEDPSAAAWAGIRERASVKGLDVEAPVEVMEELLILPFILCIR